MIVGIVWAMLIALKFVGVIGTGWLILIFWPLILAALIFAIAAVFGVGIAGIAAALSFRKQ